MFGFQMPKFSLFQHFVTNEAPHAHQDKKPKMEEPQVAHLVLLLLPLFFHHHHHPSYPKRKKLH